MKRHINLEALKVALRKRSDPGRRIILLTIDDDYTEMAINFYLISLKKFNIENYLFLTTGNYATEVSYKY